MDSVLRAAVVYVVVWALLRLAGRRTLSEATTFDFVLVLIISEATQQALLGDDFSLTNAFLVILTLVGMDVLLSYLKLRSPRFEKALEGQAMILVDQGRLLQDRMRAARVDQEDILEAARRLRGVERMDQIKYAVLENSGGITIVTW